ncbi:redoxin family protein [Amaricoccus macauensis]|uniref:redoxin family protein n=1 Tax=Amaricoccus macauensis TaxID=57001 RepID=UPI003C7BD4D7
MTFHLKNRDNTICDPDPSKWQAKTTSNYFGGKRLIVFRFPSAFAPTSSAYQLSGSEDNFGAFQEQGIDDIHVLLVNVAFVMNNRAEMQGIRNVRVIHTGSDELFRRIGMLVRKESLGLLSSAIVDDGAIKTRFEEPGLCENFAEDPYGVSPPENIMNWQKGAKAAA